MVAGYSIFGDNEGSGGRDLCNFDNFEAPSDPWFTKHQSGRCKKKNTIVSNAGCPKCGSTFLTLSQREGVTLCITDAKIEPSVDSLLMEEPVEPIKTHFTKSRCVPCGTEWVAINIGFLATDVEPLPTGLADDGTLVLRVHNGSTEDEEDVEAVEAVEAVEDVEAVNRNTYIVQAIVYLPANNVEGTITKVEKNKDNKDKKDAEVAIDVDVNANGTEPAVRTKKKTARTSCFGCAMC